MHLYEVSNKMSNIFHCAILAGDLDQTVTFYVDVLGCRRDNFEAGKWADIDFWGNELTLHQSATRTIPESHDVDMGKVAVPHFGVHLEKSVYENIKSRLTEQGIDFLDDPYTRFAGTDYEQQTFFIEDPNGNVIEIKSMSNPGKGLN